MARFSWMYCLIASLWLNQDLISDNRPAISAVPARAVVTWKQGWHPRVTPCEGTRAYSRKHTHTDTYVYIKRTLTIWRHKSLQLHTLFFLLLLIFSVSLLPDSSQHSPLYTHTFARLVSLETALIRASSGGGGDIRRVLDSVWFLLCPHLWHHKAVHTQAQSGSKSPAWLDTKFMNKALIDYYSYPPESCWFMTVKIKLPLGVSSHSSSS